MVHAKRRHAAEAAIDGGVELAEFFRYLGSSTDASERFPRVPGEKTFALANLSQPVRKARVALASTTVSPR